MATLLLEHPPGYPAERRYIYDVILGEFLGLTYQARVHDLDVVRLSCEGADGALVLPDILFGQPPAAWLTAASLPREPLARHDFGALVPPGHGVAGPLPLIYARPRRGTYHDEDGATLHLGLDVFGSAFFMLTRYEEVVDPTRDAHERFPAEASLASREGFLERPIVNQYAEVLWAALARLWPGLRRRTRAFRLLLSHDVDWPLYGLGLELREVVRSGLGDLARRRDAAACLRRLRTYGRARWGDHAGDPFDTFDFLMARSERRGVRSAFYFIAGRSAGAIDGNYELEHPWIRALMRRIHARGHEVGLHPSYHTFRDPGRTAAEFARLRRAAAEVGVEQGAWGGRQHFLRWENPTTWRIWDEAGLSYDASLGYSERVGFRAGTCYEYPAFDLVAGRPLRLRERPLAVMEMAALDVMKLDAEAALARVVALRDAVRAHDGDFTLLWHNSHLGRDAEKRAYDTWMEALAA